MWKAAALKEKSKCNDKIPGLSSDELLGEERRNLLSSKFEGMGIRWLTAVQNSVIAVPL